ncbi:hypothetical protein BGW41_007514 [Actinomortierella wolfii]|nr:hypothetical protein BGW41_007514 [Actinomortierella wolfii]
MSASQPMPSSAGPLGRHRPRGGPLGSSTPAPPFKKPALQRTVSSPFQVLSASVRNASNPFDRLSSPVTASLPVNFTNMQGTFLEDDDDSQNNSDDVSDDKNDSSLRVFSFSQPILSRPTRPEELGSDYDTEVDDDDDQDDSDGMTTSVNYNSQSKLHEALEQSLRSSTITPQEELELPNIPGEKGKKSQSETKTTAHLPLDWTLKSSLSITSHDSFEWCDAGPVTDEIDALHLFNKISLPLPLSASSLVATGSAEPVCETASSRVQVMSTLHHWIYPANAPDAIQARTIGRLLKNAANMSQKERDSIVEIFTRNSEWYVHPTIGIYIVFEVLPDITGTKAKEHIGAKHDLDSDNDEDDSSMIEGCDKDDSGHASISGRASGGASQRTAPTPSNVLHFKGRMRVHALFDFLLNYKPEVDESRLYHSPSLIASVPFLHSSLKRAQLSKSRQISKQVPGTDRIERTNRIDVQGIILPTQLKKLLELMAKQQTSTGYSFQASSLPITHGINLRPLVEDPAKINDNQILLGEQRHLVSQRGQDHHTFDPTNKLYSWNTTS